MGQESHAPYSPATAHGVETASAAEKDAGNSRSPCSLSARVPAGRRGAWLLRDREVAEGGGGPRYTET